MRNPTMDSDPTAVGPERCIHPDTPLDEVTPSAATHGAALVRTRDGVVVGVLTLDALRRGRSRPGRPATVGDVMDLEVVALAPGADEVETLTTYIRAAWCSLRRRHPFARHHDAQRRARRPGSTTPA